MIKILCYHSIDENDSLLSITPSLFQKQMEHLKRYKHKIISLSEAIHYLTSGEKLSESYVVITFDDGYKNFYLHAFPILKKFNFTATVFLVPKYINKEADWVQRDFKEFHSIQGNLSVDIKDLIVRNKTLFQNRFPHFYRIPPKRLLLIVDKLFRNTNLPILSWEDVQEINQYGIEFGTHSYSHPFLNELTLTHARDEIWKSKVEIENHIHKPVYSFCYPYGAFNSKIQKLLKDLGFRCACTTETGINNRKNYDLFALKRISISTATGLLKFRLYLSSLYDIYSLWKGKRSVPTLST